MQRQSLRLLFSLVILLGSTMWDFSGLSRASSLAQDNGQEYIVRPGDSLSRISGRFYGSPNRWPEIFAATNAKASEDSSFATIRNPSLIYSGQKLWIPSASAAEQPGEPAQQAMEPTPQPTEAVQPPTEPTAQPPAGYGGDSGQLDGVAASDQPLLPLQALLSEDEGSPLVGAQSQTELAQAHLGFLQDALGAEDQTAARLHAEHLVNILEGEEGVLFGDNDRDGQAQNPGDGVGVRGHVAQALSQAQAVLEALTAAVDPKTQSQVQELVALQLHSQELVQEATDKAFQVFAADTPAEMQTIGADLALLLNDLQANIADSFSLASELLAAGDQPAAVVNELLLPLQELLSEDEGGALASAQGQVELAQTHLSFLQDALADDDRAVVRSHAEHVVNILEGEEGVLFGDNDRDGQTQNPGDGVGVRGYVAQALSRTQAVLDALAASDPEQASVQELVTLQLSSQQLVQEATDKAFQVFAADTPAEIETMGADLALLLNDLQANIADSFALASELLAVGAQPAAVVNELFLPLQELLSKDEGGALAGAQGQVELAQTHLGFLQSALSAENQTEVRLHAEHVVNILEGEEGVLFGDNDRNGQAQNPGDGVGVRGYVAQALSQTQAVLDALAAGDPETQAQVQELVTLQLHSQELAQEATDKAFQVFAADTPAEIQTIGADLELLLNDLQATITNSFTLVSALVQI